MSARFFLDHKLDVFEPLGFCVRVMVRVMARGHDPNPDPDPNPNPDPLGKRLP